VFDERRWNDIDRGKTEELGRKTCPSATSPTTNPTWIDLGANPGLRGERPATNDLSHGTSQQGFYINHYITFTFYQYLRRSSGVLSTAPCLCLARCVSEGKAAHSGTSNQHVLLSVESCQTCEETVNNFQRSSDTDVSSAWFLSFMPQSDYILALL
jgi:hypothetical protein